MFPNLDVRKNVLFVYDYKYITSVGAAKFFEVAFCVCEFLCGKEVVQSVF
jgi:transcriptional regulator GlxA family with amidase domain